MGGAFVVSGALVVVCSVVVGSVGAGGSVVAGAMYKIFASLFFQTFKMPINVKLTQFAVHQFRVVTVRLCLHWTGISNVPKSPRVSHLTRHLIREEGRGTSDVMVTSRRIGVIALRRARIPVYELTGLYSNLFPAIFQCVG